MNLLCCVNNTDSFLMCSKYNSETASQYYNRFQRLIRVQFTSSAVTSGMNQAERRARSHAEVVVVTATRWTVAALNGAFLISVDGVWGGMLIWVIAYVNAQLGSSQCQNTSARVSECHPALAPTRRVDGSDEHTPQWEDLCDHQWCQYQTANQSHWTTASAGRAALTHDVQQPTLTHFFVVVCLLFLLLFRDDCLVQEGHVVRLAAQLGSHLQWFMRKSPSVCRNGFEMNMMHFARVSPSHSGENMITGTNLDNYLAASADIVLL